MTLPLVEGLRETISSQAHFLIKVSGFEDFFATKDGGDPTVNITDAFNGGAKFPRLVSGRTTYSDMTVGRPWDRSRDPAARRYADSRIGKEHVIQVWQTDEDFAAVGQPDTYLGKLKGVNTPKADASAETTVATLDLVFRIRGRR